jgi:hypothetical protein
MEARILKPRDERDARRPQFKAAITECAQELVADRLKQIDHHRSTAGLEENLDRHSGHEFQAAKPPAFTGWKRRADRVVSGRIGILLPVVIEIGRDIRHDPFQLRRGALIECRKADVGPLPFVHVIDLLGRKSCLDLQLVGFRHNLHNDLAGSNHSANGMDRKLVNDPVGRGAQINAPEEVLRGSALFDKLGLFVLGLSQVFHDFRAKILVDFHRLKLRLTDLGFCLGNRCRHLTALAVEPGGLELPRSFAS